VDVLAWFDPSGMAVLAWNSAWNSSEKGFCAGFNLEFRSIGGLASYRVGFWRSALDSVGGSGGKRRKLSVRNGLSREGFAPSHVSDREGFSVWGLELLIRQAYVAFGGGRDGDERRVERNR
jgi:hypothetical protein